MKVRVPASSANLGPGFDSFAVALPLLAEFELRPARAWSVPANGDGVLIPGTTLETEKARSILPAEVSRSDAVFNLAHAAALIAAVLRSDGALLAIAMSDRLHQPARTSLVPALAEIIAAAREAGAF